jgi:hypothetical protein
MTLQNNLRQHPHELGCLFVKDEECDETFFNSAIRKFGIEKVFQLINKECVPLDEEWSDNHSNALPPFMVAASCENCAASAIYYFLRRNAHALLANYSDEDSNIQNKKRKLGGNFIILKVTSHVFSMYYFSSCSYITRSQRRESRNNTEPHLNPEVQLLTWKRMQTQYMNRVHTNHF